MRKKALLDCRPLELLFFLNPYSLVFKVRILPIKQSINLLFLHLDKKRSSMLTDKHSRDLLKAILNQLLHLQIGKFMPSFDRRFTGLGSINSI